MIVFDSNPPQGTVRDWLDYHADATGSSIAYKFTDGSTPLSWFDMRNRARNIAQYLTKLGLNKGESLAVMIPNSKSALEALFAGIYGGFRVTMINLSAGNDAISYALEHCEARYAFVSSDQQAKFNAARHNGVSALPEIMSEDFNNRLHAINAADDALLMYTSGTTGRPKGVLHSHSSLLAGGWTTAMAHALTPDDCGYCVLPICHINGLCVSVMGCLISKSQLLIAPRFSAGQFWDDIEVGAATWFSAVPTIISHLLHGARNPNDINKSKLRFGRSASSALAPEVQSAFEARFDVPIIETMGMTETAAQVLSNPLPPGQRKIGSPGVAFGNDVKILKQNHSAANTAEQGEIAVRGPNIMKEYFKNPQATRAAFTQDGWLLSGDLGHKDPDGYVYVTGRLKELIIKGGENIAPREIDEALYSHADVIEAAAFTQPCVKYGERVEAAVKIKQGSTVTAQTLIEICKERVGAFKTPDAVYVLKELPKGPSGKIQRLKIAELVAKPSSSKKTE
ncbi:MAG: AMP-binding protein [Planktomarina sp.]|nr:AMP-binding protein [Planktomarina sp.]